MLEFLNNLWNRVVAMLFSLAELIPWNQFLGSLKVKKNRAQIFKPVPCIAGGVGPMTVSMLMENTVLAAVRFYSIFYFLFLAN